MYGGFWLQRPHPATLRSDNVIVTSAIIGTNILHDIVHVLVTNSIRAFPSEGRTTWLRRYRPLARVLMRIVLTLPLGTYTYAQLIYMARRRAGMISRDKHSARR
jgi:hypothetical protein